MSPDVYQSIHQVARFLFAPLGVLVLLSVLFWLLNEKREWKENQRAHPSAGIIGELVVVSGSRDLPAQTWFPVTRDGVLGSVRSCDLVVPASGVRPHHLDYFWRDGTGLLIRPRSGCEVWVNGVLMDCKSDPESAPLTHGGSLQIGEAILRLHLLAALDHVSVSRTADPASEIYAPPGQPVPEPYAVPVSAMQNPAPYVPAPVPEPTTVLPVMSQGSGPCWNMPVPEPVPVPPQRNMPMPERPDPAVPNAPLPQPNIPLSGNARLSLRFRDTPAPPAPEAPAPEKVSSLRRSNRWKEDWSE